MRFYIIVCFIILTKMSFTQEFSDSLYLHLYNFQVIKGELQSGDVDMKDLSKSFYIQELIEGANSETFSIYKFYNLKYEEALISFLIIEKQKIEIYDILSFSAFIERVLDESPCNEKTKILWIKEVLKIRRDYYDEADMGYLEMQKDYGKYHYIIPLRNLKNEKGIIE